MKLNARGRKITVPTPPPSLNGRYDGVVSSYLPGDSTPVNTRMPINGGSRTTMETSGGSTNKGKYVAPPKNTPWVSIPTSVRPTPYRNVIAR